MRKFLLSLSDISTDRSTFRTFADLDRAPDWRIDVNYLQKIHELLPRLPPVERDVVQLYFCHGKKQEAIARILGLSQQAVSHRLHSAYRRIIFMLEQPEVNIDQMQQDLTALITNPFTVRVLCDFAITSSQTVTARRLSVPQQRICWHLNAGLKAMRAGLALDAVFYLKYFEDLRRHRNILREVLAGRRRKHPHGTGHERYADLARGLACSYGADLVGPRESSIEVRGAAGSGARTATGAHAPDAAHV
ncbi:hypothetical protein BH24ACT15_BH24ACT15_33510 [soil metagenome]